MLYNYLKMAFRAAARNKLHTILNLTGLTIGMISVLLVVLYLRHEWSYDRFHSRSERIYRIAQTTRGQDGSTRMIAGTPSPLGPVLKMQNPDIVEEAARVWNYWGLGFNVQRGEHVFREERLALVDSTFLRIFDFDCVAGTLEHALSAPYTAIISERIALKYFGGKNPLGEVLRINNDYDVEITAVVKDLPAQSHFHFEIMIAYSTLELMPWKRDLENWHDPFCYTYLCLHDGANASEAESKLFSKFNTYLSENQKSQVSFNLQPLRDIHLYSGLDDELEANGSHFHNLIFLSIGVFILLIAIINYAHLSTAFALSRQKEFTMRKVLGSPGKEIIFQFFGEAFIFSILALITGLVLLELILPWFNQITGKALTLSIVEDPFFFLIALVIALITSFIAGIYPALFASFLIPVLHRKETLVIKDRRMHRRILVISELLIVSFLLIAALLIHRQLSFIHSFDLQIDKDHIAILGVNQTPIAGEMYQPFTEALKQRPEIRGVTGMRTIAGFEHIKEGFTVQDAGNDASPQMIPFLLVNQGFLETFGVNLVSGRDFSETHPTDYNEAILINQTFSRIMNWDENDAPGKMLVHSGWGQLMVIGVVKDFNFESLHQSVKPLVIKLIWPHRKGALTDFMAIRIQPDDVHESLAYIRGIWETMAPGYAFEYRFLGEHIAGFYTSENTLGKVSVIFAFIAVINAVLGLFGFISFVVLRRSREIALRKALGASTGSILLLLTREFVLVLLIATVVSWPMAWFALGRWLENFAYRVTFSPMIFVLAFTGTFALMFMAIAFHTIKAARANPVEYLREE